MITYETRILVRLDGTKVGEIRSSDGGWRYYPKGSKDGGEWYRELEHLKQDLEGDDFETARIF